MKSSALAVIACLMGLGGGIAQAQAWRVDAAERLVHESSARLERLRADLAAAGDRQAQIVKALDEQRSQRAKIDADIGRAEADLRLIRQDLDAAREAERQAQSAQGVAAARLDAAQARLQAVMDKAVADLEASNEHRAAAAEVARWTRAHQQAVERVREALSLDVRYRRLSAEAEQARTRVESLRAQRYPDLDEFRAADESLYRASRAVLAMEQSAMDADLAVVDSRSQLERARAHLASLKQAFEADLQRRTDVASARASLGEAQAAVATANQALRHAQEARAGIEQQERSTLDWLRQAGDAARQADQAIATVEADLAEANRAIRELRAAIPAAEYELAAARAALQAAQVWVEPVVVPTPVVVTPPVIVGGGIVIDRGCEYRGGVYYDGGGDCGRPYPRPVGSCEADYGYRGGYRGGAGGPGDWHGGGPRPIPADRGIRPDRRDVPPPARAREEQMLADQQRRNEQFARFGGEESFSPAVSGGAVAAERAVNRDSVSPRPARAPTEVSVVRPGSTPTPSAAARTHPGPRGEGINREAVRIPERAGGRGSPRGSRGD